MPDAACENNQQLNRDTGVPPVRVTSRTDSVQTSTSSARAGRPCHDRVTRPPSSRVVAYLTSAYARASDSFIRGEVAQLRDLGFTVHTFSVRKSPDSELVSDEIRREHANTEFLLERRALARLPFAAITAMLRAPRRVFAAARLALKCAPPGLK